VTDYLPFPDTVPLPLAIERYEDKCGVAPNTIRARYTLDLLTIPTYITDKKWNIIEGDVMCLPGEYWLSWEEK